MPNEEITTRPALICSSSHLHGAAEVTHSGNPFPRTSAFAGAPADTAHKGVVQRGVDALCTCRRSVSSHSLAVFSMMGTTQSS